MSLPVDGGAESLVQVVRRLDEAGIKVVDIALRRPSLDDVFLTLTGHTTALRRRRRDPAGGLR